MHIYTSMTTVRIKNLLINILSRAVFFLPLWETNQLSWCRCFCSANQQHSGEKKKKEEQRKFCFRSVFSGRSSVMGPVSGSGSSPKHKSNTWTRAEGSSHLHRPSNHRPVEVRCSSEWAEPTCRHFPPAERRRPAASESAGGHSTTFRALGELSWFSVYPFGKGK